MTEQKRVRGKFVNCEDGSIQFVEDETGDWYMVGTTWAFGVDPYKVQNRFNRIITWFKKLFK